MEDETVDGKDTRVIHTLVSVPIDPATRQKLNQGYGVKEGESVGGIYQEDYMGSYIGKPSGSVGVNQGYEMVGGQIFGTNSLEGVQQSAKHKRMFAEYYNAIRTEYPNISNKQASVLAQQKMSEKRNLNTGNQILRY